MKILKIVCSRSDRSRAKFGTEWRKLQERMVGVLRHLSLVTDIAAPGTGALRRSVRRHHFPSSEQTQVLFRAEFPGRSGGPRRPSSPKSRFYPDRTANAPT